MGYTALVAVLMAACDLVGRRVDPDVFTRTVQTFQGGPADVAILTLFIVTGLAALGWPIVAIHRLHDTGRSGAGVVLLMVPVLGWIWLGVLLLLPGTRGRNRYGADPRGGSGAIP